MRGEGALEACCDIGLLMVTPAGPVQRESLFAALTVAIAVLESIAQVASSSNSTWIGF